MLGVVAVGMTAGDAEDPRAEEVRHRVPHLGGFAPDDQTVNDSGHQPVHLLRRDSRRDPAALERVRDVRFVGPEDADAGNHEGPPVLSLVFLHAGAASVVAQPEARATEIGWWQHALSAAHASIARVRAEAIARSLGEMPEVKAKLSQRASGANQKTTTGRVTERDLFPKIPVGVRSAGERTVLEYLDNHHLSHVRSARNHPELAADPNNLVFEPPKWNLHVVLATWDSSTG